MPSVRSTWNPPQCKTVCAAVCFALLAIACSRNNAVAPATTAADPNANPPAAESALGTAKFSALLDGVPVSGGPIDELQQQNAAYTVPGNNGAAPNLLFYLSDMTPGSTNSDAVTHSFRIQVPRATGPATAAYLSLSMNLDANHAARYSVSNATVTILSITATRVTGTFSGTMKLSPDFPNVKKQAVTVTDGRFDIPLATSKLFPS